MSAELARLSGVSFTYPGASAPALAAVDLTVRAGELVLVMGRSGAGKTTLARCLNRAIPAYQPGALSGEVWVDGIDAMQADVADLAGVVGLVTQDFEAQLFSTNVLLEIAFGLEQQGVERREMGERVRQALDLVGLVDFEKRDPSTLSGGEKQRLSIAAVVAMRPKLIVFDEPTTDLDPRGKREIFSLLGKLCESGTGIVLVEHEVEAGRNADRVVLMDGGEIVGDGPPSEVLRRVDRLSEIGAPVSDLDRVAEALGHAGRFASASKAAEALVMKSAVSFDERDEPAAAIVTARDVDFAYPDGPPVLRGISLDIRAGELAALVGPNGSGKTTFSKHLNGLLRPRRGSVSLADRDLASLDLEDVASDIGYVFQNPDHQIFSATVLDEVRFAAENLGLDEAEIGERAARALAAVDLSGFEDRDPFLLGKGHRQRLAVASLLVLQPRLLILDEPTTGLDATEQREMMELLVRLCDGGTSVLIITHTPWVVAEHADRCIALAAGQVIFDGATREFLGSPEIMRRCDFEPPQATKIGAELGVVVRSVDELLSVVE